MKDRKKYVITKTMTRKERVIVGLKVYSKLLGLYVDTDTATVRPTDLKQEMHPKMVRSLRRSLKGGASLVKDKYAGIPYYVVAGPQKDRFTMVVDIGYRDVEFMRLTPAFDTVILFTSHFFKRYATRRLKMGDMYNTNEALRHYMIDLSDIRRPRVSDEDDTIAVQTSEGQYVGTVWPLGAMRVLNYNTYIDDLTLDKMTPVQLEAYNVYHDLKRATKPIDIDKEALKRLETIKKGLFNGTKDD